MTISSRCGVLAALTVFLGACTAETSSPAVADHFEVVGGAGQTGTFGRALDSALVVRVVDDRGAPMVGKRLTWTVTAGGGTIEAASAETGVDGIAQARWRLGTLIGTQAVQVRGDGLPTLQVTADVDGLRASAVAVAGDAACALDPDGHPWCWGGHYWYQYAPNATYGDVPVRIDSVHAFTSITAGIDHFCALTGTGEAWCWGAGDRGELGTGAQQTVTIVPTQVAGGHAFTSITASWYTTCALDPAGQAWCWGTPGDGSLGTGSASVLSPAPVQQGTTAFASIAMGYEHICALESNGQAWCWGHQDVGQLGDSLGIGSPVPRQVAGPTRFRSITAGDHFTCAIALDGTTWCWGAPPIQPYRERPTPTMLATAGMSAVVGDYEFMVGLQAHRPLSAGLSWYVGAPEELGGGALTEMPGGLYGIRQIALRWATICMVRSDDVVFCAGEVPGHGSTAEPVAIPAP